MIESIPSNTDVQDKVFAFLTDPATHPGIRRIDTHAASVFLEGTHALKIKRAVRFPYLDYSTLAKRKAACEEEMKINRLFAPQIYRRVVPITQGGNGSLSIDGDGAPVEFAIEMTRFDERQTIDHLAEAGELDHELVDADRRRDRGLPRRRATRRRLNPGSNRSRRLSNAIPQHSEPRPAFQRVTLTTSSTRLSPRFPGSASCWSSVAGRDMCGVAMATCIWRTSC